MTKSGQIPKRQVTSAKLAMPKVRAAAGKNMAAQQKARNNRRGK